MQRSSLCATIYLLVRHRNAELMVCDHADRNVRLAGSPDSSLSAAIQERRNLIVWETLWRWSREPGRPTRGSTCVISPESVKVE
jgi:hypothetical protein